MDDSGLMTGIIITAAVCSIIIGLLIIDAKFGLTLPIHPLRLLTPRKVKAYRKLRMERINAGTFFLVTRKCGHSSEVTGVDLYRQLDSIGEYLLCPECLNWVRVTSLVTGRLMTEQEKEQQMKDYLAYMDEVQRMPNVQFGSM